MVQTRAPYEPGGLARWMAKASDDEVVEWVRTRPPGFEPVDPDDPQDPDQSALMESIGSGLILTEDDRWLDPDDAIEELGARGALRTLLVSEMTLRGRFRERGRLPGDDGPRLGALIEDLGTALSGKDRIWRRAGTLAEVAGRKNLTQDLLADISDALFAASIYHHPADLTYCRRSDTIYLSREPIRDPGLPFESEVSLSEFVRRNYRHIEPFRRCTSVSEEVEYEHDPDIRIDLVFREQGGGYVVCELENGTGHHETGSQITLYMEAVTSSLNGEADRPVRGVVLSAAPNPPQVKVIDRWLADHPGHRIDWFTYRLDLDLEPQSLGTSVPD